MTSKAGVAHGRLAHARRGRPRSYRILSRASRQDDFAGRCHEINELLRRRIYRDRADYRRAAGAGFGRRRMSPLMMPRSRHLYSTYNMTGHYLGAGARYAGQYHQTFIHAVAARLV